MPLSAHVVTPTVLPYAVSATGCSGLPASCSNGGCCSTSTTARRQRRRSRAIPYFDRNRHPFVPTNPRQSAARKRCPGGRAAALAQAGAQRPVCWACPAAWGCKSPVQPDGGEARAKRKGGTARNRLKEAWSKIATRRTETGYEAGLVGRAGRKSQSPYPSRARTVHPAGVRGRLRGLPQEICTVSSGTEGAERPPDRGAEVSRGHSVCLAAGVSGGLKSHSVRGPGPISEGGGNASPARVDGRYGEASEARRRKPGHG